jgi:hypothetical protein
MLNDLIGEFIRYALGRTMEKAAEGHIWAYAVFGLLLLFLLAVRVSTHGIDAFLVAILVALGAVGLVYARQWLVRK